MQPTYPGGRMPHTSFEWDEEYGVPLPDYSAAVEEVCGMLQRPAPFIDEDGYERCVIAGAVNEAKAAVAWVEYKCKQQPGNWDVEFRVREMVEGRLVLDRTPRTYNPFFGCGVKHLDWHEGKLVMIYSEKHATYAWTKRRIRILPHDWLVRDDVLYFRSRKRTWKEILGVGGAASLDDHRFHPERPFFVCRRSLPTFRKLPSLTAGEAAQLGCLPPGSQFPPRAEQV